MYQLSLGYPFGRDQASTYTYLQAHSLSASLAIWSILGEFHRISTRITSIRYPNVQVVPWLPFWDGSNLRFDYSACLAIWSIFGFLHLNGKHTRPINGLTIRRCNMAAFALPVRPNFPFSHCVQWIHRAQFTTSLSPPSRAAWRSQSLKTPQAMSLARQTNPCLFRLTAYRLLKSPKNSEQRSRLA
jgi:hypothetical protein